MGGFAGCYRAVIGILVVAGFTFSATPSDDPRLKVPGPEQQKQAIAAVQEAYKAQIIAATSSERKSALAKNMLQAATETADDPAGAFALFQRAREISLEASDAETALAAIAELNRRYQVDGLSLQVSALTDLSRSTRG